MPKSQVSHCLLNTVFLVFSVRNLFHKCLQFKWHNDGFQQFRHRQALNISNCRPCKKVGLYRVPLRRQDDLSCIRRRRHRKTVENPLKAESSVKRCSWQDEAVLLSACSHQSPERFPEEAGLPVPIFPEYIRKVQCLAADGSAGDWFSLIADTSPPAVRRQQIVFGYCACHIAPCCHVFLF